MTRIENLTKSVKAHDSDLYAQEFGDLTWIMRKSYQYETYEIDGKQITFSIPCGRKVLPLTENWSAFGRPVEWGALPIVERLKQIDSHNRNVLAEVLASQEKLKASSQRDFHNKTEAFFYDARSAFKKQFEGINTSTIR